MRAVEAREMREEREKMEDEELIMGCVVSIVVGISMLMVVVSTDVIGDISHAPDTVRSSQ